MYKNNCVHVVLVDVMVFDLKDYKITCGVKHMPNEPLDYFDNKQDDEEYRKRAAARSKRRQQRKTQKLMLVGAFALAVVLVIVCFIFIISAIFSDDKPQSAAQSSSASLAVSASQAAQSTATAWPTAQDPSLWNLMLVSPASPMPDGYAPPLTVVSTLGHNFHADAAAELTAMMDACNAVEGNSLQINSAYRGPQTQQSKRDAVIAALQATMSETEAVVIADEIEPLYPMSDHQTALGLKFVTGTLNDTVEAFEQTPEYLWLVQHAHEYGFILRYPRGKESITGIRFQPYHWRYVGKEAAAVIQQYGITLEEYLGVASDAPADASAIVSSAPQSTASVPSNIG